MLAITGRLNTPARLTFNIWVTGSLLVNWLGMGINLLHQLLQASRLLIGNTAGFLGDSKEAREWDLIGIP